MRRVARWGTGLDEHGAVGSERDAAAHGAAPDDRDADLAGAVVPSPLGPSLAGRSVGTLLAAAVLAVLGLVGLTLDVVGPVTSPLRVAVLLAVGALVIGRRRPWWAVAIAGLVVALAVSAEGLDLDPGLDATSVFAIALGILLVLAGLATLVYGLVRRRVARIEVGLAAAVVGGLAIVASEQALFVAQQVVAIALLVTAGTVVLADPDPDPDAGGTARGFGAWSREDEGSWEDRRSLVALLSFEGEGGSTRFARFLTLMAFASTLASLGVVVDSTAIVIGAMLVAPLMTPLMATALSLAVGWPRRATRGAIVALSGIALAVAIGALVGATVPMPLELTTNPQVVSRSAPSLIDFAVALAAGGAGGFALARSDVSDALPGVAVAISLVPPLTVVGLTLESGDLSAAAGATLLFATNVTSILLAGGAVFVATGIVPSDRLQDRSAHRTIRGALVFLVLPVVVGLSLSGHRLILDDAEADRVRETATSWAEEHPAGDGLRVDGVTVDGDLVVVELTGVTDAEPDIDELLARLTEAVGREATVRVELVPRVVYESGG